MTSTRRQQASAEFLHKARQARSPAEAEELLLQAAHWGNREAMEILGYDYQNGEFGEVNLKEAMRWYLAAAINGSGGAMSELGDIFVQGQYVQKDILQAYTWYQRGAELGDEYCQQKMEEFQQMQERGIIIV